MTTAVVIILVVLLLFAALRLWITANRLDRLHVRTEAAWSALEGALARRVVATRAVAAAGGLDDERADELRRLADVADHADRRHRADAENDLSRVLSTIPAVSEPHLAVELADAGERVLLARRFYNDAVRDTRALRAVWFTRIFGLAGRAALPDYFEIAEYQNHPATVHRAAARVLLIDPADRVLLLSGTDPEVGSHWWHTPGGGVEPGESPRSAAARELAEETGFRLSGDELLGPIWRRVARFTFMGSDYEQTELFFVAAAPRRAPALNGASPGGATPGDAAHVDAGPTKVTVSNAAAEHFPVPDPALQHPALQASALQASALQASALQHPALQHPALQHPALQHPALHDPSPDMVRQEAPTVDGSGRTQVELMTLTGDRWWSADALAGTTEAVYPVELAGRLPEAIGVLRGAAVPQNPAPID